MRAALIRPRQNDNHRHNSLSVGAVVGIAIGVAAFVVIAAAVIYMFIRHLKRDKAMKRQSGVDEHVALSEIPPPQLTTRFSGRPYTFNHNARSATFPPHTHAPQRTPRGRGQISPQSPEEARVWAEWLVKTEPKPKPPPPTLQTSFAQGPEFSAISPWLEATPSISPAGAESRITNIGSEDLRSPIELELAQDQDPDVELEQPRSRGRATSGPLPGPSAMPVSPPLETSRTTLHPPPRMISIKRKPIVRSASAASVPPTIPSEPSVSPPSASPKSTASIRSSSRPPSLPYPDFNVPTSPDELFIPQAASPLGPILELGSPLGSLPGDLYRPASAAMRNEDVPVLLARERVEMLREERERLERIHELKKLEEQAKRELREAQRSSLERRSGEAQRRGPGGM
jgi:hypothetical protein